MGITRSIVATAENADLTDSVAAVVLAGITVNTSDTLVVGFGYQLGLQPINGMSFAGQPLIQLAASTDSLNYQNEIWAGKVLGDTGDLTVNCDGAGVLEWGLTVATLTSGGALRNGVAATGVGTAPASGNLTSVASPAIVVGSILRPNATINGTWSGAFTQGQTVAKAGFSLEEGYKIIAASGTYSAAKTGETSATWYTCVAAIYEDSLTPPTGPGFNGGRRSFAWGSVHPRINRNI